MKHLSTALPLSLLLSAWLGGALAADEIEFEQTFGGGGRQVGNALLELDDGYVVVGYTDRGGADVLLVRTDLRGELVWQEAYDVQADDFGWDIVGLPDGGFLVAGFCETRGSGDSDVLLLWVDASGKVMFEATYGGPGDERCWSLCSDGEGGFVLAGETRMVGSQTRDLFLLRVDRGGNELWSTTPGGPGDDRVFEIAPTEDGGFVCVGITTTESAGERDAYVVKIDAHGDLRWERRFGGAADDVAHGVTGIASGDILVTGYGASFGNGTYDVLLWKLNESGELLWQTEVHEPGDDRAITSVVGRADTYYTIGYSTLQGDRQMTLIRTNGAGDLLQRRVFVRPGPDRGVALITTTTGDLVLTGERQRPVQAQSDLWLLKLLCRSSAERPRYGD